MVVQSTRAAYVVAPRPRTDLQTVSWRLLREEWASNPPAQAEAEQWERNRGRVRPKLLALLHRFVAGNIGLEQFRSTFDRRTRTDWDAFALKGASGAMFLNAIVKHAEHPVVLARQVRAALRVPKTVELAHAQLADFVAAVAPPALALDTPDMTERTAAKATIAPTHAVFFATACWHLHDPDQWPSFQPSSRQVLHDEEELFVASGEPVRDYFAFRDASLSLAAELSLTTWQLEHLCWWHARRSHEADEHLFAYDESPRHRRSVKARRLSDRPAPRLTAVEPTARIDGRDSASGQAASLIGVPAPSLGTAATPRSARNDNANAGAPQGRRPARNDRVRETPPPYVPFAEPPLDHVYVQWLLAKVGHQLGCRVWIAANDRKRAWGGELLGALSIPRLPPLGLSPDSQRLVSLIDVVWLSGENQVAAAFEVEHTTSVYSGLLRMADLAALSPNLRFPLYVVAPASRLAKVRRELGRPTFRALGMHRRCRFFSSEALLRALPHLARWATGPESIEKLAEMPTVDD